MKGTFVKPAVFVLVRNRGKLLFVLRTNTGWMDTFYGLPAGHAEPGEPLSLAAARETLEEANVIVDPLRLRHVHTMHRHGKDGDADWADVYFETPEWSGEPRNNEPHKHGEIVWFAEKSLPHERLVTPQAAALRAIAAGQPYSEWGWPGTVQ